MTAQLISQFKNKKLSKIDWQIKNAQFLETNDYIIVITNAFSCRIT